ncbi:hypothetical protein GALMADRAFT_1347012 [Galerina marginata CBS 339.88]|uniref:Protein kinase domain-containing protein n=1 Tax=Galerina marginata (strain CBS 339.88) TaxID=685588 RepID=A0A067TH59_GALM3|nr:hypothetical protein GALMADRAFT_1347012 [Galerina marginata CBS 339.88]
MTSLLSFSPEIHSFQILAIQSLHKKGIIHRDIKTDNIFLDEQGHLILADLGLAENIATHLNPLQTCGAAGTFWYTAPEVFKKEHYSFGVDYWSVGVIYHELITGHVSVSPFFFSTQELIWFLGRFRYHLITSSHTRKTRNQRSILGLNPDS